MGSGEAKSGFGEKGGLKLVRHWGRLSGSRRTWKRIVLRRMCYSWWELRGSRQCPCRRLRLRLQQQSGNAPWRWRRLPVNRWLRSCELSCGGCCQSVGRTESLTCRRYVMLCGGGIGAERRGSLPTGSPLRRINGVTRAGVASGSTWTRPSALHRSPKPTAGILKSSPPFARASSSSSNDRQQGLAPCPRAASRRSANAASRNGRIAPAGTWAPATALCHPVNLSSKIERYRRAC